MGGVDRPQLLALRSFCMAQLACGRPTQRAGPSVDRCFGGRVALGIRRGKGIVHVLSVRQRGWAVWVACGLTCGECGRELWGPADAEIGAQG